MKFLTKKYVFAIVYAIILILFSTVILLDALVFEKGIQSVVDVYISHDAPDPDSIKMDENGYEDNNIKISITYDQKYDSNFFIADIQLRDIKYLKTALAKDTFGRNIIEGTRRDRRKKKCYFCSKW